MLRNTSSQKMNLITAGDAVKEHVKITTVRKDVLTIVSKLKLSKDEEDVDKSSVHKFPPEVLTGGHTVLAAAKRMDKIPEGMEFNNSLFSSTKHSIILTN